MQHTIKVIVNNASYTINIYNTTSRFLINGYLANHFIVKDIPSIHKIVLKGLHEQGVIEELNRQLGNQLQNLLDNGNDLAKGNKRNEQLNSEDSKKHASNAIQSVERGVRFAKLEIIGYTTNARN